MGNAQSGPFEAAAKGDLGRLREYVARGQLDPRDQDGWTPLMHAAFRGRTEAVRQLLAAGADYTLTEQKGRTALHLAAFGGSEEAARVLAGRGARVGAQDRNGLTPLHMAVTQGHDGTAEELIRQGADVNAALQDGTTPVHLAAHFGHLRTLKVLLVRGANYRAVKANGETALHEAAEQGHEDIVDVLLSLYADPEAKEKNGDTPAVVALRKGHKALAQKLLDAVPGSAAPAHAAAAAARASEPSYASQGSSTDVKYPGITLMPYADAPRHEPAPVKRDAAPPDTDRVAYPSVYRVDDPQPAAAAKAAPYMTAPVTPAPERDSRPANPAEALARGMQGLMGGALQKLAGGGRHNAPDPQAERKAAQEANLRQAGWGGAARAGDWGAPPAGQQQYSLEPYSGQEEEDDDPLGAARRHGFGGREDEAHAQIKRRLEALAAEVHSRPPTTGAAAARSQREADEAALADLRQQVDYGQLERRFATLSAR